MTLVHTKDQFLMKMTKIQVKKRVVFGQVREGRERTKLYLQRLFCFCNTTLCNFSENKMVVVAKSEFTL